LSRFVLDNSVCAAWCFGDQRTSYTQAVLQDLAEFGGGAAPSLWPLELANALVVAERRNRLTAEQREAFLAESRKLDISVRPQDTERTLTKVLELARSQRLSAYDAAYLDLAIREGLPLATKDVELERAALATGVQVFPT